MWLLWSGLSRFSPSQHCGKKISWPDRGAERRSSGSRCRTGRSAARATDALVLERTPGCGRVVLSDRRRSCAGRPGSGCITLDGSMPVAALVVDDRAVAARSACRSRCRSSSAPSSRAIDRAAAAGRVAGVADGLGVRRGVRRRVAEEGVQVRRARLARDRRSGRRTPCARMRTPCGTRRCRRAPAVRWCTGSCRTRIRHCLWEGRWVDAEGAVHRRRRHDRWLHDRWCRTRGKPDVPACTTCRGR